jgi:hypothetical protein
MTRSLRNPQRAACLISSDALRLFCAYCWPGPERTWIRVSPHASSTVDREAGPRRLYKPKPPVSPSIQPAPVLSSHPQSGPHAIADGVDGCDGRDEDDHEGGQVPCSGRG